MRLAGTVGLHGGDPYAPHRYQLHPLGARGYADNGDIFRYAYGGATDGTDYVAGYLYTATARVDNHQNITVAATTAVGDNSVTLDVGATALTANQYDEGFLIFNDNSPEGEWYKIDHHGTSSAGSEEVTFYVKPDLKTISTVDSSEAALVKNPWRIPAVSQLIAQRPCGIPVVDWDLSTYEQYGWLKTHGIAACIADTTGVTVGYKACISDQVNGAVGVYSDVDAEVVVGQMEDAGTATEFNPIYLTID
jgi:hypothetical protein